MRASCERTPPARPTRWYQVRSSRSRETVNVTQARVLSRPLFANTLSHILRVVFSSSPVDLLHGMLCLQSITIVFSSIVMSCLLYAMLVC